MNSTIASVVAPILGFVIASPIAFLSSQIASYGVVLLGANIIWVILVASPSLTVVHKTAAVTRFNGYLSYAGIGFFIASVPAAVVVSHSTLLALFFIAWAVSTLVAFRYLAGLAPNHAFKQTGSARRLT